ncbi:MAG: nickel pincer cofactor biosynthesis protein LarB [Victivallaceae bacterium]|nr:nickel pincer cofactor biosynthesis protein LarB [Victivallaceae bacterium]
MDDKLKKIMEQLDGGEIDIFSALALAAGKNGIENMDFARIDHGRKKRCGFPEFIYGENKTVGQLEKIIPVIMNEGSPVLVTRIDADKGRILKEKFPEGKFDEAARVFIIKQDSEKHGKVIILSAGTSDLNVALEAKYTLESCDVSVCMINDVGVAGLHRLLGEMEKLKNADAIIVVAGMEGALPSVVGGMVSCPVIAVPTSIGYGAALKGFAALLGMLNSCASGVTVVNIDNGFGAACAAARIIHGKVKNRIE